MEGFCSLASGSKGNATYVGTKETKILVDAGLNFKHLTIRLEEIGVNIEDIDAVVVTHEHTDHIKGLEILSKKLAIPVFANRETAKGISEAFESRPKFKIFSTGEPFSFGDLEIFPFSVQHDTLDPVAFTIQSQGKRLGICTDLGFATSLVKSHLCDLDALIIEANHDEHMVHASSRPYVYKERVLGRQGHLSNKASAEVIKAVYSPRLKEVFLAHLSSECNHPKVALETIESIIHKDSPLDITLEVLEQDRVNRFVPLFASLSLK
ncbi:MAG: MBL fold metallo-hydrolase [Chlamydiae bacterium]|nr:MBL fold metallo-hydrolase [Chlamydiota bacterium]